MAARKPAARRPRAVRERPTSESTYAPARILLDTHSWLWWQGNDRRLGQRARQSISKASAVYLSAASVWEMSIKIRLGKLVLPSNDSVQAQLTIDGFEPLGVSVAHAEAVTSLPLLHNDPFDRMLVVQAQLEELVVLTADPLVQQYDVRFIGADE